MKDKNDFFDRPLFEDSSARALSRVGVVDVGSNSVRMVVFDGAARSPAYFYNEKVMAGLGKGLVETGRLNPEGRNRALIAMRRFAALAEGMGIRPLTVVATAAVREAEDGPAFRQQVEAQTGLKLRVINGDEEARLSAQGVLLGWPDAAGIVCDIGGNSMELAQIGRGKVGARISTPLGPFRLQQIEGGSEQRQKVIERVLRKAARTVSPEGQRIYLVGGSWRVIARLDMERRGYPLTVLHEYRMSPQNVLDTIEWIRGNDPAQLRARTGASSERMELIPLACEVLGAMVRMFNPREIDVSSYGIREGLLYEQMPQRLRERDPLLEAARQAEATQARKPGFGKKLFQFLMPLFGEMDEERARLTRAACMLHDTSWRAHPDYRAELCFETATRANLGGLDHVGRVFLGVSLLHRYKNSRAGSRFQSLFELLTDDQLRDAEILGKAMRFGSMFSLADPTDAASLTWDPQTRALDLRLNRLGDALFAEVAQARFTALASAMEAVTTVTRPDHAPLRLATKPRKEKEKDKKGRKGKKSVQGPTRPTTEDDNED